MAAVVPEERADELARAYAEGRAATQAILYFARRGRRYGLRITLADTVSDADDQRMAAALCLPDCAGVTVGVDERPAVRLLLMQATVLAADVDARLENTAL